MLELVRLTGVTQIPRFKRKNLIGYVEYWNAGCGESRMSGVDAGKERKLLPMHTRPRGPTYRYFSSENIVQKRKKLPLRSEAAFQLFRLSRRLPFGL